MLTRIEPPLAGMALTVNDGSIESPAPTQEQNAALAEIFRILGDSTRLRIVFACLDRPIALGDLAEELTLSPSLVSHHLGLLQSAHIIRTERQGKTQLFQAADNHIAAALRDMAAHIAEPANDAALGSPNPVQDAVRG